MDRKTRVRLLKVGVWLGCLTPIGWVSYRIFFIDGLGANPINEAEHWAGRSALVILLTALAVTPVRRVTGFHDLQKLRRLIGLFAFFYFTVHFFIWLGIDQFFEWQYIGEDLVERPFIWVGFTAFLMLIPMAVTSTKGWIRRLGRRWVRLHRLVYVVAPMGVLHYFWATKLDNRGPMLAAVILTVLLGSRLWWAVQRRRRRASRSARRAARGDARSDARGDSRVPAATA